MSDVLKILGTAALMTLAVPVVSGALKAADQIRPLGNEKQYDEKWDRWYLVLRATSSLAIAPEPYATKKDCFLAAAEMLDQDEMKTWCLPHRFQPGG